MKMRTNITLIKNIILMILLIVYGTYQGLNMMNGIYINDFNEIYLSLWERGLNGIFLIIYLIILFEVTTGDLYTNLRDGLDKHIITRIGYKDYYKKNIIKVFIRGFIFALATHICICIGMNLIHNFDFISNVEYLQRTYFSENIYINLVTFILLSSLGSAIYCEALFPYLYFVKNKYLVKFIPVLVFFFALILSFVISPIFQTFLMNICGNIEQVKTILCSIIPTSLIEPGCGWYSFALLDFVCGTIVYLGSMIIGYVILSRYRGVYDD